MHLIDSSRLDVVEYFDDLVNQIDIVIENNLQDKHLSFDHQENLNSIRCKYLDLINKIKKNNLQEPHQFKNLRESEINTMDSSKQGDVFCFFINHELFYNFKERLKNVGILIVTDFYLSQVTINKIR